MSDPATFQLVAAGAQAVPALLWTVITVDLWYFLRKRRPGIPVFRILLGLAALLALHYVLWTLVPLIPANLRGETNGLRGLLLAVIDGGVVALYPVGRHFALLWSARGAPPQPSWLVVNYGAGFLAGVFFVLADLGVVRLPAQGWLGFFPLFTAYVLGMGLLTARDLRRLARREGWRAGGLGDLGSADVRTALVGFACIVAGQLAPLAAGTTALAVATSGRASPVAFWFFGLHALGGLVLAVPFAVRDLADNLRGFLTAATLLGATAAAYFGVRALGARVADGELRRLVDLGAVLGIVLVAVAGQAWLGAAIDRLVFHRSRDRWAQVHSVLQSLSPELGVLESARQALAEVVRAMQFKGAALLLADGEVAAGDFAIGPLRAVWPHDPAALPAYAFGHSRFRALPARLREALDQADVTAVIPVVSPRRHWGHVFVRTDLLGATFSDEDDRAVDTASNQLALLLDGAELLARAVAVERSLAHAEKLAAIGELAARIAHDIRNPVTAARSLAQQLARETGAPFAAEHRVILEELERVERQVAALLRFARREEFHFAPVDLGELVRGTVEALRPRLEAAGIGVVLEAPDGIMARADRERMRQVLINLIENACDAMTGEPGGRRSLSVAVGNGQEVATVRVADTGPGMPADALPHLFEPFFSLKPTGTGLGLAIAKRTVDAHGGRIEAASPPGAGMILHIELPLAEGA